MCTFGNCFYFSSYSFRCLHGVMFKENSPMSLKTLFSSHNEDHTVSVILQFLENWQIYFFSHSCGSSSLFPQKFSQTVISFAFFCLLVLSFIQVPLIIWRKKVAKEKGKGSWKIILTHIHLVDAFFFIQKKGHCWTRQP